MKIPIILSAIATAGFLATTGQANVITVSTASGATESGGSLVDASATFTTGANSLTITLSDLLNNPTSVAQLISDVSFSLSSGQTSGTLSSSSGTEVTVAKNGTLTLGSSVSTGWALSSSSGVFDLNVLGTSTGPSHLIIGGPGSGGVYTSAKGSIAGNDPHNPFLAGSASFTLSIPGVTSSTDVTGVNFSFGTTAGDNVPGVPGNVPDGGTTVLLLGASLTGLGLLRRKLS